jgi:hypothetical protein
MDMCWFVHLLLVRPCISQTDLKLDFRLSALEASRQHKPTTEETTGNQNFHPLPVHPRTRLNQKPSSDEQKEVLVQKPNHVWHLNGLGSEDLNTLERPRLLRGLDLKYIINRGNEQY